MNSQIFSQAHRDFQQFWNTACSKFPEFIGKDAQFMENHILACFKNYANDYAKSPEQVKLCTAIQTVLHSIANLQDLCGANVCDASCRVPGEPIPWVGDIYFWGPWTEKSAAIIYAVRNGKYAILRSMPAWYLDPNEMKQYVEHCCSYEYVRLQNKINEFQRRQRDIKNNLEMILRS